MSEETQSDGGDGPKGTKPNGKPRVVPLPQKREVSEDHLAHLRTSGLTDETIKLAELYTEKNPAANAQLIEKRYLRMYGWAIVFPFYLPGATSPHSYRIRASRPRVAKNGKPVKYDQSSNAGQLVYFAPRARQGGWYRDVDRVCYWTEGEKKDLLLDQLGLCCVGVTGVDNWHNAQLKAETGEWKLHPHIVEHVAIAGRHHVICYDASSKDDVKTSAARLAGVLLAAGALSVLFVQPPTLEHKGIDDFFVAFGEQVTRQLLDSAAAIEPIDPRSPFQLASKVKALQDAPIDPKLRLPDGYEVNRDSTLWKLGDDKHGAVRIASSAVLVSKLLFDYYSHEVRVELCFQRQDAWTTRTVSLKAIKDKSTMLLELGNFDSPVTSNNAARLVDWFDDFLRVNDGIIPRIACVSRAGWHHMDGDRIFVLNEPVLPEGKVMDLAVDTRGDRSKLFGSLAARGTLERHVAALKQAWEADATCAAMICGALAATLLEPLAAPNFAVHLSGDSSSGKTTKLKIAASVFGDPNNEQLVASWNTTSVAAELRAQALSDLPMCFDEVGASGDVQRLEQMVYQLINGVGKARGTRELAVRETPSWRTVVLSTGERSLADESAATGAQIRVIQFSAARFAKMTATEIDALRDACAANSGALGRAWVEAILTTEDWKPAAAQLQRYTAVLRAASSDPLQNRVASFFALLMLVERTLAQLFGLGRPNGETMASLFGVNTDREVVSSLAVRSVQLLRDKDASDPDAFSELSMNSAGDWDSKRATRPRIGYRRPDGALLSISSELTKFFTAHNMSARTVIREWRLLGWLELDPSEPDRNSPKNTKIDGHWPRLYVLLPHAGAE